MFVAISNHLLDAAKSNRCALLTRAKPDKEELMNVARGCLGRESERRALGSTVPGVRRGKAITVDVDPSLLETTRVGLLDFFCECCPMMVFMLAFFGFMDYMILYKWVQGFAKTLTY